MTSCLIAQTFSDQKDFDTSGNPVETGKNGMGTDTVRIETVGARTGDAAGGMKTKADSIGRRSKFVDTADGFF